ncbi:MAG: hypothetical protein ACOY4Q_03785 [Bacillota bacterium]
MLNQWFKLAILAFVGIIVSSLAISVISGFDNQTATAPGIHGTAGSPNTGHNAGPGGNHTPDASGAQGSNYSVNGNVNPGYGPSGYPGPGFGPNGQLGPYGNHGPWGAGYGPGPWMQYNMQQNPGMQMNPQGNMQGMQNQQDPMGGGMMNNDKMEMNMKMKMGMM